MGIKSTYYLNRETAINVILQKIDTCTNEQLSNMLEDFDESYFRNYTVFDVLPSESDDDRTIKNVEEF